MGLDRFFGVLRHWLWLIVLGPAVAGFAAYFVMSRTPPTYRATASIWVTSSGLAGGYTSAADLENFSQTYAQLIPSIQIIQRALTAIGDTSDPNNALREVTAQAIPRTAIVDISVTDRNPEHAAAFANAIAEAFATTNPNPAIRLQIADLATIPTELADRRMGLIGVLIASFVGLVLSTMGSLVLDFADDRFRSAAELEDSLGIRFLGALPRPRRWILGRRNELVIDPSSDLADRYRRLRSRFLNSIGRLPTSLLVVSSTAAVDRSRVILNLAASIAECGARVTVVDADLQNPWLAPALGVPERLGFSDVVERSNVSAVDTIRIAKSLNISYVTAGMIGIGLSSTLSSPRVRDVIEGYRQSSDILLVGCAPIVARSDASVLSTVVDKAVIVLDAQREPCEVVARSIEELRRSGAIILGAIVTNADTSTFCAWNGNRFGFTAGYESIGEGTLASATTQLHFDESPRHGEKNGLIAATEIIPASHQ